jgi:hypothetical protein
MLQAVKTQVKDLPQSSGPEVTVVAPTSQATKAAQAKEAAARHKRELEEEERERMQ